MITDRHESFIDALNELDDRLEKLDKKVADIDHFLRSVEEAGYLFLLAPKPKPPKPFKWKFWKCKENKK